MSLWAGLNERYDGVAILLNPYSSVNSLTPYLPKLWTGHWTAATA